MMSDPELLAILAKLDALQEQQPTGVEIREVIGDLTGTDLQRLRDMLHRTSNAPAEGPERKGK
jgi:hypothetical protein